MLIFQGRILDDDRQKSRFALHPFWDSQPFDSNWYLIFEKPDLHSKTPAPFSYNIPLATHGLLSQHLALV